MTTEPSRIARDIMEPALILRPTADLAELARQLLASDAEGACVCGDDGKLVGVVTGMDLVAREHRREWTVGEALVDLVLTFGSQSARELERLAATTVGELMSPQPVWAEPDTPIGDVATSMVRQRLSTIPVLEDGVPIGVVTRRAVIGAAARHLLQS